MLWQSLNYVSMASRREIFDRLRRTAEEVYPTAEARQIAEMITTSLGGITRNDLIIEPNKELTIENIDTIVAEIRAWRPVQYIIGHAYFADMELEVTEGVLIPRPETEELVEWVAQRMPHAQSIVDVCCGSGCIAIALSRSIKHSRVWGIDISPEALAIARRNGARYAPDVEFIEGDALCNIADCVEGKVDVVISNPPYIPEADRSAMRRNVTDYEPAIALFVPNDDPLLFYRAIARQTREILNPAGELYFEIYEQYGEEMCAMLQEEGYGKVLIHEDFRGKQRMICARV